MRESQPIASGPYAGRTAYIFSSKEELAQYQNSGMVSDGDICGFEQSVVPEWTDMSGNANYGVFISGSGGVSAIQRVPGWSVREMSLHELPDPGWTVDSVTGEVTGPDGSMYILPAILALIIWVIKIVLVIALVLIVGAVITAILGAIRSLHVATSAQLSDTVAVVSYPDGAVETIDKATGKSIHYEPPPSDLLTYILIGGVVILAILILPKLIPALTGRSGDTATATVREV